MRLTWLHHVQVAMPAGREDDARAFYGGALEIHLGVDQDFRPARKAHPAIIVDGLAELSRRLVEGGYEVVDDTQLEGHERCYGFDPFGNRLEFLEPNAR